MLRKSKSEPYKLCNKINEINNNISFSNFNILHLEGSQQLLTFGEYNIKKTYNRKNIIRILYYFYKNKI
jgi:hypothetical protein